MTSQTTSPTVTCLILMTCGVSPQHIPNDRMYTVCVWVNDDVLSVFVVERELLHLILEAAEDKTHNIFSFNCYHHDGHKTEPQI